MFCSECGSPLADGTKFCPVCGAPVQQAEPAGQPAPGAAAPQPDAQPAPQPDAAYAPQPEASYAAPATPEPAADQQPVQAHLSANAQQAPDGSAQFTMDVHAYAPQPDAASSQQQGTYSAQQAAADRYGAQYAAGATQQPQTPPQQPQTPPDFSSYGNSAPAGSPLLVPVQTDRSLLTYILLGIITFGIYALYFNWKLLVDCERVNGRQDTTNPVLYIVLSCVTCGIYNLYCMYRAGDLLQNAAPRYGMMVKEGGMTVLLWMLVGFLLCGIGPFIAMNILIKNCNAIGAAYNASGLR